MTQATLSNAHAAAIDYLYGRINYEQTPFVHSRPRKQSLDHMRMLLSRLGDPHLRIPAVHIAGTKGKGSTAAMIDAALRAAGYHTGLYTSPHLSRLEERYVVDALPCTADELTDLVAAIRPAVTDTDQEIQAISPTSSLTFFEITTAMMWLHFIRREVQVAVLEVGMGGRLDSTNLCRPLVTVITSISFDHTKQLGSTLAEIAREKAGIIKPGVPVISGETKDEPAEVIAQVALDQGAPLFAAGNSFEVAYDAGAMPAKMNYFESSDRGAIRLDDVELGMLGRHQAKNAGVALATLHQLNAAGLSIPEEAARRGLREARCPARIQIVRETPTVILDTAHNVASIETLIETLSEYFRDRRWTLLFAASKDKDLPGMLEILLPKFHRVILTQYVSNPRSVPIEELEPLAIQVVNQLAATQRPVVETAATPEEAWQLCQSRVEPDEVVCVTGSFFLAAELRDTI